MNDFDFDELDRAVNSVLTKEKPDNPKPAADTPPLQSPSSVATDAPQDNFAPPANDPVSDPPTPVQAEQVAAHAEVPAASGQPEMAAATPETSTETAESPASPVVELTPLVLDDIPAPAAEAQSTLETGDSHGFAVPTSDDSPQVLPEDQADGSAEEPVLHEVSSLNEAPVPVQPVGTTVPLQAPSRRGRFMDIVASSGGTERPPVKPAPARSTITLKPSADFASQQTDAPAVSPLIAAAREETASDMSMPASVSSELSELDNESPTTPETAPQSTEPVIQTEQGAANDVENTSDDEQSTSTPAPLLSDSMADEKPMLDQPAPETSSPFIPDVPVDKRPLNSLSEQAPVPEVSHDDAAAEQAPDTAADTAVQPAHFKEFSKEVMAVEANETIGAAPPPDQTASSPDRADKADKTAHHPLFDTSSILHAAEGGAHQPASKMTWIVVGVSLFMVGAVLGVLYFLYGQS